MNTVLPQIGTSIYASIVRPGFIVKVDGCEHNMPVNRVTEQYNTIVLDDGCCHAVLVAYGDRVTLVGYFNPDPPEELRERNPRWFNC